MMSSVYLARAVLDAFVLVALNYDQQQEEDIYGG